MGPAPVKKKQTAAGERSSDTWKPMITYYGDESQAKDTHASSQPRSGSNLNVDSTQVKPDENLQPRDKNMAQTTTPGDTARMLAEDLIDFSPSALAHVQEKYNRGTAHPMSGNADLLSDAFGDVSLSGSKMGFEAMLPNSGGESTNERGMFVPPNALEGVREALEINKAGKAVTWNWSEEPPQVREVTREECEELQPTPAFDEFMVQRWDRPWLAPKVSNGSQATPMEIDRNGSFSANAKKLNRYIGETVTKATESTAAKARDAVGSQTCTMEADNISLSATGTAGVPASSKTADTAAAATTAKCNAENDEQRDSTQRGGNERQSSGGRDGQQRDRKQGQGNVGKKPRRGRDSNGTWNKSDRDGRPKKRPRFEWEDRGGNGGNGSQGGEGGEGEQRRSNMRIPFSAEEIAAEERRPKRKVAVMIGYAGTGYRGMQINHDEKTIEGDLFAAFVAAGAIAKTNADDPKKSSLVRCARTDKGVHAAGNVISLKLIVEDADVVERINAHLPPQIRVWGIQRTINSFSCYQACDSRWYEYLLPSYALLPPHPDSFLGREMVASARRADAAEGAVGGMYDDMVHRLEDVRDFWSDVERDVVTPILDGLDAEVRRLVVEQLHATDFRTLGHRSLDDIEKTVEEAAKPAAELTATAPETPTKAAVDQVLREIKTAYVAAKRRYRITPTRLARLQEALSMYEGTSNFHNYTVQKSFKDASAKRHIKSFVVNPEPIQMRDTQWLSLRVHGQSFMMHQIRKMVAMAVMLTRCGTAPGPAMKLSYGPRRISIPRAPGFGLLLERPVFDSYNLRAQANFGKEPIDFDSYGAAFRTFKDEQIYARIWDVEESQNLFHAFFHQLDNYNTSYYMWAIPGGFDAAFERFGHGLSGPQPAALPGDEGDEVAEGEEGDG
ncbi:tRNA pseudouridine synthase [Grosmannia clavigera kw1407]|uniref:tRNA pseudouridine synthase 1 n=1 Tax=Grosmannia clavigera (strain kw1407 / UAMH 11150) TaxID=655863 RepID=F0XNJ4_GROCL|nr:tRNA pseudouridine synthase [Grosmannia clavigera kw1407]EFX00500.1 tRNA pseudouridine synthase [Grosmannia clavigera kw1407]